MYSTDSKDELKKLEALNRLATYLNKPVEEHHMTHYIKQLRSLSAGFVIRYCADQMKENAPGMRSKFPSTNQILTAYRDVNPDQRHSAAGGFRPTECDDCNGIGLLWFKREDPHTGYPYEYMVRCAACNNWKRQGITADVRSFRKQDLLNQGREVYPYGI